MLDQLVIKLPVVKALIMASGEADMIGSTAISTMSFRATTSSISQIGLGELSIMTTGTRSRKFLPLWSSVSRQAWMSQVTLPKEGSIQS